MEHRDGAETSECWHSSNRAIDGKHKNGLDLTAGTDAGMPATVLLMVQAGTLVLITGRLIYVSAILM